MPQVMAATPGSGVDAAADAQATATANASVGKRESTQTGAASG
jgi:hypothetical protein